MDYFSEKKLLKRLVIVMVVLNAILITVFLLKPSSVSPPETRPPLMEMKGDRGDSPPGQRPEGIRHHIHHFLVNRLNFSEEQIERFRTLRDAHFTSAEQMRRDINRIRKSMMTLLSSQDLDMDRVAELSRQIGDRVAAHEQFVFRHFQELLTIPDEHQKEAYREFILGMFRKEGKGKDKRPGADRRPPRRPGEFGPPGNERRRPPFRKNRFDRPDRKDRKRKPRR